jgi:hypothetical protein
MSSLVGYEKKYTSTSTLSGRKYKIQSYVNLPDENLGAIEDNESNILGRAHLRAQSRKWTRYQAVKINIHQ